MSNTKGLSDCLAQETSVPAGRLSGPAAGERHLPRERLRAASHAAASRPGTAEEHTAHARGSAAGNEALVRLLDVGVSLAALALLSPLMLVIAVLIKFDSPGPILFRHVRIGVNRRRRRGEAEPERRSENLYGRPFVLYKFRSMHTDARERFPDLYRYQYSEEEMKTLPIKILVGTKEAVGSDEPESLVLTGDPRVTRLGRWLRRTSLDELPNFINVLKGDMHLVGPRPDIAENIRHYRPEHMRKLDVKPGITGLAQVNGRGKLSFHQTNEYDVKYVDNRSLWLDLRILFKTIVVSIKREGAL